VTALPDGVHLRPATADDAPAAARMHLSCWREAYSPFVDAELLEARLADPAPWEETWRDHVEHGPPRTLAVTGAGELVGFAVAGPSRDAELPGLELYAIYVRFLWWGKGVGQALLDEVVGDAPCSLWVLEDNARALAFYARNGFRPDGGRELMGWLDAWEVRLVRGASSRIRDANA
jgi:GNAT superfamily N-acetyltransferase